MTVDTRKPGNPELKRLAGLVTAHAAVLSDQLQELRLDLFPPSAEKPLRAFQASEVAKLLGVKAGYLRSLSLEGKGPAPLVTPTGRRSYTAQQILELRSFLSATGRASREYDPRRRGGDHLQVIPVLNFKGGSCKTTTTAHLAQYLALRGHRVLAIDLDPQASLSALHGFQPERDLAPNQTLYGAIRYDDDAQILSRIVRKTNFPGLDIVPAGIELMEFEYETSMVLATGGGKGKEAFFTRIESAISDVGDLYDVVVMDCPPHLGFLTMACLCAATSLLVTIHPQMLDVMSMSQFLLMMGNVLASLDNAGVEIRFDWMRYLITRYDPADVPQSRMVGFVRKLFGEHVIPHPMLKSVAISDAGMTKQTLYEVERRDLSRNTYDRAMESLEAVNGEIERLIHAAWHRTEPAGGAEGEDVEATPEVANVA